MSTHAYTHTGLGLLGAPWQPSATMRLCICAVTSLHINHCVPSWIALKKRASPYSISHQWLKFRKSRAEKQCRKACWYHPTKLQPTVKQRKQQASCIPSPLGLQAHSHWHGSFLNEQVDCFLILLTAAATAELLPLALSSAWHWRLTFKLQNSFCVRGLLATFLLRSLSLNEIIRPAGLDRKRTIKPW